MPVAGLPAAAESALNALLADNNVSSWKVVGEGDSTVIVLRLKPHTHSSSANMADSRNTQGQYFRRKPPSQIRRDQERSRLRNEQSTKADQASGNNFDFPPLTFSSLNTNLQMTTQDTATEKCRPARTEITADSSSKHNSENGSDVSNLHDFCQPEPLLFAVCDDSLTHPTAEFDERFIKGRDAGFSVDIVKDCCNFNRQIRPATIERPN